MIHIYGALVTMAIMFTIQGLWRAFIGHYSRPSDQIRRQWDATIKNEQLALRESRERFNKRHFPSRADKANKGDF